MFRIDKELIYQLLFLSVIIVSIFITRYYAIIQGKNEMCKEMGYTYTNTHECLSDFEIQTRNAWKINNYTPQIELEGFFENG
jgi:hypothetical protein